MRGRTAFSTLTLLVFLFSVSLSAQAQDDGNGRGGRGGGGRGPRPSPTPTETATPAPTATSTPTPSPAVTQPPANTQGAYNDGYHDGLSDGGREGGERGPIEGERQGWHDGYQYGFNRCYQDESQRQYDRGYAEGHREGEYRGSRDGEERGRTDGLRQGESDGIVDGRQRADQDANRDAPPLGTQKGIEEAEQSDASQLGYSSGLAAGEKEARDRAIAFDYPRGRDEYRRERFAENVSHQDQFNQKSPIASQEGEGNAESVLESQESKESKGHYQPDYRYFRPRRNYPNPDENSAYRNGYGYGYNNGFRQTFDNSFERAYRRAHNRGSDHGCHEALRQDFRPVYDRGHREGYDRGYQSAYQSAYQSYYRDAYRDAFTPASETAYREEYPRAYDRHFENARATAYKRRYGNLYDTAFEQGRGEKFNELYPQFAEQEYRRGRSDEEQDFQLRPVRLLSATATETIENGLYEPGEELRIRLNLRNFSDSGLAGRDVRVQIQALDHNSAVISESEATLIKDLRGKSVTQVSEALEFRLNEAVVNRVSRFVVSATYQGRTAGQATLELTAQFLVDIRMQERPALKEGLPMPVRVTLRNQSSRAINQALKVRILTNHPDVEISQPELSVGMMGPGETVHVDFTAIARSPNFSIEMPLAFQASTGQGRRVGLLDLGSHLDIPVINDYRIVLTNSVLGLKKGGVTRAGYTIRNISSRLTHHGLQLKVRVIDTTDPTDFIVIGPNPQYLHPLERDQTLSFTVPILSKKENNGGVLELEVQEYGNTVVIHRVRF